MSRRNAIILAAGTSSRFVPLSVETPKGLLEVKGEILIERQIQQLKETGIKDIILVTGYLAGKFEYLRDKFGVSIVYNPDYMRYNNISSLIRVIENIDNTFICSADNYFTNNVFNESYSHSCYSALYSSASTHEYYLKVDQDDNIINVRIGGEEDWYMIGHVYLNSDFSIPFKKILIEAYKEECNRFKYWEDIYIENINTLPKIKIRRYRNEEILEFDTLDELRQFDNSYFNNSRSRIVKRLAERLQCSESELYGFKNMSPVSKTLLFSFFKNEKAYLYDELKDSIVLL